MPAAPPPAIDALRTRARRRDQRAAACRSSAKDVQTIDRFHRRFIEEGLSLRFQSTGGRRSSYYPTYRQLLHRYRRIRTAGKLSRLRRGLSIRQGPAVARPDHPGRRRPERTVGDCRDWQPARPARHPAVRLLRVERRVLPVRRRVVCTVCRQSSPPAARGQRGRDSLRVRRFCRRISFGRRQRLAGAAL